MKIDKNKLVFGSILAIVVLFIVAYSTLVLMGGEEEADILDQPLVPELKEDQRQYTSKIEALDALKEVRRSDPPSVYSEKLLDSLGVYDPAKEERDREWIIDSIYRNTPIGVVQDSYPEEYEITEEEYNVEEENPVVHEHVEVPADIGFGHERFFLAATKNNTAVPRADTPYLKSVRTEVNGTQTLKTNDRLELILKEDFEVGGEKIKKNTAIYAFVTLQPNRVFLKITHVGKHSVELRGFDLQDNNEGIYIENTFRAEAGREVLDDVVQDINIAGLPQISGIKNIFRRNHRNLKVTILDQYQLILKTRL